jgi:predicted RNA-binding protein YlqC (UPF0109 family)
VEERTLKDLLISIASGLVNEPDQVTVEVDDINEEGVVVYHLHVAQDDMGRVIGKQGRIAKAIRTVMRATANRSDTKISVEID